MQITNSTWQENAAVEVAVETLSWRQLIITLFKLRVVSLLLLSAFGGAALGIVSGGEFSGWSLLLLAITGTLSASGASAINQYLERERDTRMRRTAKRPLATGQITKPEIVMWLAGGMVVGASALAGLVGNWSLAFWLFMGAFIYVVVYTIWLKPRTTLNIVIGGAAGSCAVISGGAAVGAAWALPVWLLAMLVFTWTPVHFWALALAYREDYVNADYPMLPAKVSSQTAALWTAVHTVLTAGLAISLGLLPQIDLLYLLIVGLSTVPLVKRTIALMYVQNRQTAFALFGYSNLYLAIILAVVMLAMIWR